MRIFLFLSISLVCLIISRPTLAQNSTLTLGKPQIIEREVDPAVLTTIKLQDFLSKYEYPASQSKTCEAGNVLLFDNVSAFHTQLRRLNRHYINNDEDDLVLSAFEFAKPLSSLRMEMERLDGANVDHTLENITSDDVFSAMLNKSGFIVIDGQLYLWDDGCLALQIPFQDCNSLQTLQAVQKEMATFQDIPSAERNLAVAKLFLEKGVALKNICQNAAFDFDAILESDKPTDVVTRGSAGCGLSAYVSHQVISHDPVTNKMRIRFDATGFGFPNSTILQTLHIDDVTQAAQVTVLDGDLILNNTLFSNADWFDEIINNWGGAYPGRWVEIEVDGNLLNRFDVRLVRNADLLSGNSCVATDEITIDVLCPVSLSHAQLNGQDGAFRFDLTGFTLPAGMQVEWRFGDGVIDLVTGQTGIVHAFPQCGMQDYTVTATVKDEKGELGLCQNPISAQVEAGNPGLLERYRESKVTGKHDGKRYKLVEKIKPKWLGLSRKSKVKNKFRYRKDGTKTITAVGDIHVQVGNDCPAVNLQDDATLSQSLTGTSSDNPASHAKKRKLKQKIKTRNRAYLNCATPYRVEYQHSNGFGRTVQLTPECPN